MCHIFFVHSSVDGHLGGFHTLAVVSSAAMNTGVSGSQFQSQQSGSGEGEDTAMGPPGDWGQGERLGERRGLWWGFEGECYRLCDFPCDPSLSS